MSDGVIGNKSEDSGLPSGGTVGQHLVKQSSDPGDADWQDQGSGTGFPEVANYAALPAAGDHTGEYYVVLPGTTVFSWLQKSGLFRSNGSTWLRLSNATLVVLASEFLMRDNTDTTKRMAFALTAIATGQLRTITMADQNIDLADIPLNNTHRAVVSGNPHSVGATEISDFDTEVSNNSSVVANTAKVTNATHTGEVTGSTALTIANDAVTLAKMADMATASLLGRNTAATGDPEVLSAATARSLLNVEDGATADQSDSEIKTAYENNADTNEFSNAEQTKLAGIATAAIANVVEDTTPQLGGDLDLNQNNIVLDPTPTSDHTWNGLTVTATAAEGVVIGDVCYLNSAGKFAKIDADAEATTKGFCVMATATIATDATGVFLLPGGFIRDDTWAWTVGAELYASTTPGNPTATAPSAPADIVRIMGYAYSADIIFFDPDDTYVEI